MFSFEYYQRKRFLTKSRNLFREYMDFYEFCIINRYEKRFPGAENSAIQLKKVYASVVEKDGNLHLVSIQFPKSEFNLQDVAAWLLDYGITTVKDGNTIKEAGGIVEGVLFKGTPLLLYAKGRGEVAFSCDEFLEVTETFTVETQEIYTERLRQIDPEKFVDIIYNGERRSTVPSLEFLPERDLIISGGNLILADRLDRFGDCVAFFRKENNKSPVAIVLDQGKTVHIKIAERGNGSKTCTVSVE